MNHVKFTTHQQYVWEKVLLSADLGFQNNHREEWSLFHTHYGTQSPPEQDPDKELAFELNTFSTSVRLRLFGFSFWEHTVGWDVQHQRNAISGYAFLLPEYHRFSTGLLWLTTYRPNNSFSVSGGIRYDYGAVHISSHEDNYLATYLIGQGYDEEQVESYRWNSHKVNKRFGDYSLSLGMVWNPVPVHLLKINIGRSFRLPGANELASNGVHHGTFRHEQGDALLASEQGWQLDTSYLLNVGACLFLFLRMSVGLAIIFFCTLPENGLCYLIPDKFTGMRKQKLCSSVWKQRSVSIFSSVQLSFLRRIYLYL